MARPELKERPAERAAGQQRRVRPMATVYRFSPEPNRTEAALLRAVLGRSDPAPRCCVADEMTIVDVFQQNGAFAMSRDMFWQQPLPGPVQCLHSLRLGALSVTLALIFAASGVIAAEGGVSFYIPGFKGPLAGFLPPPGLYYQNDSWFYEGKISGERTTVIGGNVVAGVKQRTFVNFATPIWVTPVEILGGNLAFSLTVPFGEPSVRASAVLNGPIINRLLGRPVGLTASDSTLNFGDPVLTSMVGWHADNWHWNVGTSVNIPAGAYQPGELSNVALNRWIGDFFGAATYLDQVRGIELSAVGGLTLNGENPDTDYRTGKEVHLDVALSQYLSKDLSIGVLASHYRQISGDSGAGDRVGPFKGRVTAVGGTLGYTFKLGDTPVSTRVKVLREVDVENRFQGTIGWLQISLPLSVPQPARPAEAKPLTTKF